VLLELSSNDKNASVILPYLTEMHKRGHWRSKRFEDWGITLNDKLKSSTGYVGLKNLGCICYMNSLNQQLFMIPYFRYSITNAEDPSAIGIKPD
jgi:ubiquitin carboxyl-terminal hydrolase 9/24